MNAQETKIKNQEPNKFKIENQKKSKPKKDLDLLILNFIWILSFGSCVLLRTNHLEQ